LREAEEEIDEIVAELDGITDEELKEVRKTLRVLKGEDVER
jgi:signal transduction histidine kinase